MLQRLLPPPFDTSTRPPRALLRRAAFTLGVLVLVRLGYAVPLPGLDTGIVTAGLRFPPGPTGWLLGSRATTHVSVLALGLMPLLSAFVLVQVGAALARRLRPVRVDMAVEGAAEEARVRAVEARLGRWMRGLTFLFALLQAYGIAIGLSANPALVREPGLDFVLPATLTLTAGALTLAWLAEQISARGLGNGMLVILAANYVADLPRDVAAIVELARMGVPRGEWLPGLPTALVQVTAGVLVERARRRVPVVRASGQGAVTRPAHLALRLNPSGPLAPIFAYALLPFGLSALSAVAGLGSAATRYGHPLHLTVSALALVGASLALSAHLSASDRLAAGLARTGGAIPGVPPGPATVEHLDATTMRLALVGGLCVAVICLAPEMVSTLFGPSPVLTGYGPFLVTWTVLNLLDSAAAPRAEHSAS